MIIGWNKDEGLVFAVPFINNPENFEELKANWDKNLATAVLYRYNYNELML